MSKPERSSTTSPDDHSVASSISKRAKQCWPATLLLVSCGCQDAPPKLEYPSGTAPRVWINSQPGSPIRNAAHNGALEQDDDRR